MNMANRNLTVLVIEDDEGVRQSIVSYLVDTGLAVIEATGGREGIELFERDRPDIVFTDLMMPEVDGLAVVKEIRRISPETPLVVISANGSVAYAIETVRKGAWEYITKPIGDFTVFDRIIDQVLNRAQEMKTDNANRENLRKAYDQIRQLQEQLQAENAYLLEEVRHSQLNPIRFT